MSPDVMVAVDVGGTGIKAALVARDGTVRHRHRCPTGADRGPEAVVATVLQVAGELTASARAGGLHPRGAGVVVPGVVVPGVVDETRGIVVGGGLAEAGETLLAPLRTAVKERLTFHREPGLVPAALGDEAGCLGAGLLGFDRLAQAIA